MILFFWPKLNILIFLLIFGLKIFLGIFVDSGVWHFGFIDFDGVEVKAKSQPRVYNSSDILTEYILITKKSVSHDSCSYLTGAAGKSHETCNLGKYAGHAVVTRKGNSDINNIIHILTNMSDRYGNNQKDWNEFQLFNSTQYGDDSNLLFKDSTTELKKILSNQRNYEDYLGEDYLDNTNAINSCHEDKTITAAPPSSTSSTVSPIIELVLLIGLLGAAHRFL